MTESHFKKISNLLISILSVTVIFYLSSCVCTKMDCESEINQIHFQGFTAEEVDTIDFITYASVPDDSLRFFIQNYNGTDLYISLPNAINYSYTYKVRLVSNGEEYWLKSFKTSKKICNHTEFNTPCDYYTTLDSYLLNDNRVTAGDVLLITK